MGVNAQTCGGCFRGLWSPEAFLGRKGLPRAGWPNQLALGRLRAVGGAIGSPGGPVQSLVYQVKPYPLRVEILVIKIRPKDTVVRVGVPIR
jgi:hypothetical protein